MRLIDNARCWWKQWSTRIQGLAIAIQGLMILDPVTILQGLGLMPPHIRSAIPVGTLQLITGVLFALSMLSIVARQVKQPKLEKKECSDGSA